MNLDFLKGKANDLFGQFGDTVTYRVTPIEGPSFDPQPGTPVDYVVNAAPPMEFSQDRVDGTLIQLRDLRVSIAAEDLPVVPSTGSDDATTALIIDGEVFQIVAVHPVKYGTETGHYDLQVRR